MNDEPEDLADALVRDWKRVQKMTPQQKLDRWVRITERFGVPMTDEAKAELLASYIGEDGRLN